MDRYEDFKARVAAGVRPGKAARAAFGRHIDDKATQELAELAGLDFSISADRADFVSAYADVLSCMVGKGGMCHEFYSSLGAEIAVLRNAHGEVVARALVAGTQFPQCYGAQHYVLEALLCVLGYKRSADWLAGRTFAATVRMVPSELRRVGGAKFAEVSVRNLRYFMKRGWRIPSAHWPEKGEPMVKDGAVEYARTHDVFIARIDDGWRPVDSTVLMKHETPERLIPTRDFIQKVIAPWGQMPWIDGYRGRENELLSVDDGRDPDAWHPYEWAEKYAA